MANTKRRAEYTDRNGNMFMPMNVEGGTWNEHFITTPKLICIVLIVLSLFFIITYLNSENSNIRQYIIWIGLWGFASLQILRFIVFEEKFYYKMYKELQDHEISSPSLFWDIASIKDTDEGAIMTYSDAKIGVMVKLDRDTITGKNLDFKETHYDAISDFYRDVANMKYSFIQMNIMEQAGKDPRLHELSKLVYKSDNDNICKLMEMEVGYIKNVTHSSLYESDYFLFFTQDLSKIDTIIGDISECIFRILDGAYIGYTVLSSKDIVDFVKEEYGVNYFNSTDASLQMFDRNAANIPNPFNLHGIIWKDGEDQELTNNEVTKIRGITSKIINETLDQKTVSFKKTVYRKNTKNKFGVDFNKLSDGPAINLGNTVNNRQSNNRNNNINGPRVNMAKPQQMQQPQQRVANNKTNLKKQPNDNVNKVSDEEEYIDL